MITANQIRRRCGVRCGVAAALMLAMFAAPLTVSAVELTAPSGKVIEYGIISGGGVYNLGTATHHIQSAVGQTAIGMSQTASEADIKHGWPKPEPEPLELTDPTPAVSFIYGNAQDFEVKATGGDGNYTFTWEFDPDGFGTGTASQTITGPSHPNSAATVAAFSTPSLGVSRLSLSGIPNATSDAMHPVDGYYRCTVADGGPDADITSSASQLTKRNPVNVTITGGQTKGNYTDSVTITTTRPAGNGFLAVTYQWAFSTDGGATYTDLTDGTTVYARPGRDGLEPEGDYTVDVPVVVSGATGPVLTIDHPLFGVHQGRYRCTVTDSRYNPLDPEPNDSIKRVASNLTVTDQVAIIRGPQGGSYYAGNEHQVDVAATGGTQPELYVYSWYFNTSNLIQTSSVNPMRFIAKSGPPPGAPYTYQAPPASSNVGYTGQYRVLVTWPSVNGQLSANTVVTVQPEVNFPSPLTNQTKNVTETVTFSASAAGGYPAVGGYGYAWTFNGNTLNNGPFPGHAGTVVSGATTNTLTITNLVEACAGEYGLRAKDANWPCTDPPNDHNDKCTAETLADLTVTNHIVIVDDPASLDVYSGDTATFTVDADGGDPPYFYEWYWTAGGITDYRLSDGPHPSGTGAAVSGSDGMTLTVSNVGIGLTAETSDAGEYYAVVRDGSGQNNPGTSAPAVLGVYAGVSVTDPSPASHNKYVGESASYSVTGSGGLRGERTYQWQRDAGIGFADLADGADVSGATTPTLLLSNLALDADADQFRCVVSSPDSDVPTAPSNLTAVSGAGLLNVTAALAVLNAPADMRAYVTDAPFVLRVEFEGGMAPYAADWRRTGVSPAVPEASAGAGQLESGPPQAAVLTVDPGLLSPGVYAYAVELTDAVQTTRSGSGTVEIAEELEFVRGLSNAFARMRERFRWSVEVGGGLGSPEYQWYKLEPDGSKAFVPVPEDAMHQGTTAAELTFVEVDAEDAGTYKVVVSDDFMEIESQAELSVGTALPAAGLAGLVLLASASAALGALRVRRRNR